MIRIFLVSYASMDPYFIHPCNVRCNAVFKRFWQNFDEEWSMEENGIIHNAAISVLFDLSDDPLTPSVYVHVRIALRFHNDVFYHSESNFS